MQLTDRDPGWVYLLRFVQPGFSDIPTYLKVGKTNKLDRRVKQLKIQLPFPVVLQAAFFCNRHSEVERLMHRRLADFHVKHEWFLGPYLEVLEEFDRIAMRVSDWEHSYFLDGDGRFVSYAESIAEFKRENIRNSEITGILGQ